jgi:hypothetical protein
VQRWSQAVAVGGRGQIDFLLANAFPITELQVKLGAQVVAEVTGQELRDVASLSFSMPRTPGNYNISIFAKDSFGCTTETTTPRLVTVS